MRNPATAQSTKAIFEFSDVEIPSNVVSKNLSFFDEDFHEAHRV
jgi:hypothetical protein